MNRGKENLITNKAINTGQPIKYQLFKDAILEDVAKSANVAQFVSFSPELDQRFSRIWGYAPNCRFPSPEQAVRVLLENSPEASVNVRSFDPMRSKAGDFHYKLGRVEEVMVKLRTLAQARFFTIVNETINVNDGGVSGVAYGGIAEFAPDDTPRCVEKPGTVSIPLDLGVRLLETVYRFPPSVQYPKHLRVEFSVHPTRRGFRREHTVIWEIEEFPSVELNGAISWPNRFSRYIGDKAFGLLVSHLLGLPVPLTLVISRLVAPFQFGKSTGTAETWIRTCPSEQIPGLFKTQFGWCDPFQLLAREDPGGTSIASILAQESVEPVFSGAAVTDHSGTVIVEGVLGPGDKFMQGQVPPQDLPVEVTEAVRSIFDRTKKALGPIRIEWVYDGHAVWVVQLHKGQTTVSGRTIFPGNANYFHHFKVERGLGALRKLISKVQGTRNGIILLGNVGVTSHFGDLLRRAGIPSLIEPVETYSN
jgi:hypothetical protein